jgi:hypothetical protein
VKADTLTTAAHRVIVPLADGTLSTMTVTTPALANRAPDNISISRASARIDRGQARHLAPRSAS